MTCSSYSSWQQLSQGLIAPRDTSDINIVVLHASCDRNLVHKLSKMTVNTKTSLKSSKCKDKKQQQKQQMETNVKDTKSPQCLIPQKYQLIPSSTMSISDPTHGSLSCHTTTTANMGKNKLSDSQLCKVGHIPWLPSFFFLFFFFLPWSCNLIKIPHELIGQGAFPLPK